MALACAIGPLCCLALRPLYIRTQHGLWKQGVARDMGYRGNFGKGNCPLHLGENISYSALWLIAGYLNFFLVVRVPFALPYALVSFQTKFLRCSSTWSSLSCHFFRILASNRAHPLSCNIKTFSCLCNQRTAGCYLFCTVQDGSPRYCAKECALAAFFFCQRPYCTGLEAM